MTPTKMKTKSVSPSDFEIYLTRAKNLYESVKRNKVHLEIDSIAILAIHASISLGDAICVKYLGRKSSGEHSSAANLLIETALKNVKEKASLFRSIVSLKSLAKYEGRRIRKTEVDTLVLRMERFFDWGLTVL